MRVRGIGILKKSGFEVNKSSIYILKNSAKKENIFGSDPSIINYIAALINYELEN